MVLSDGDVLAGMDQGRVVIYPFDRESLATSSYDVRLGEWYYREQRPDLPGGLFNPYDQQHVERVWGEPQHAGYAIPTMRGDPGFRYGGMESTDQVIVLEPGETILAHTDEFIGGRVDVTTMMKARSSMGRSFILVCKCLHPDTMVRTAYGNTVRIVDLKIGDALVNATRYGQAKVARVKAVRRSSEAKRVITFVTKGGRQIIASEDHLFKVSTSDGVSIMSACDLKEGDALPVLRQAPRAPGAYMGSPSEAALIGYFLAEGNWQKYRLSFAKDVNNGEQRAEIMQLMRDLFPDAPEPVVDDAQIMYNSVEFAAQFQYRYPEMCRLAEEKRVPALIMNCNDLDCVRAFLKSYMRCDAHMRPNALEIEFTSRSEALIYDLAYLTAQLGACPKRFTKRLGTGSKGPCTSSYYYGSDASILGHPMEEKVPRAWAVNVPNLMRTIRAKYNLTRANLLGFDPSGNKAISRSKLIEIWKAHRVDELAPYCRDLVWDEIETVTRSEVLQSEFVDISLDVASEDDALFTLDNGLMTLNCAGWGDVGYANRWTMEITNVSRYYRVPLVVGSRIAQIVFLRTGRLDGADYTERGAYAATSDLAELRSCWHPGMMLPQLRR